MDSFAEKKQTAIDNIKSRHYYDEMDDFFSNVIITTYEDFCEQLEKHNFNDYIILDTNTETEYINLVSGLWLKYSSH
jgi:tRNA A58 N-methylase Trm61